jgi:acyl-CoA dehydrogenase
MEPGAALAYAKERETFGRPLIKNQVIRHKLVEMRMCIEAARANLHVLVSRVQKGESSVAELCMLKVFATATLEWVANDALQILGGAGYLQGSRPERIYRETKVLAIGGRSVEIMKDLAARQMAY